MFTAPSLLIVFPDLLAGFLARYSILTENSRVNQECYVCLSLLAEEALVVLVATSGTSNSVPVPQADPTLVLGGRAGGGGEGAGISLSRTPFPLPKLSQHRRNCRQQD